MTKNPSTYLSSTLDKCCSTYFSWNLNGCLGRERGICARALYYPDWENKYGNKGCLGDGNEPKYMTDNPLNYLFDKLSDCCDQHYSWDVATCLGTAGTMNSGMWYPDFVNNVGFCANGGGQPNYMNNSPTIWLSATLAACCTKHNSYNEAACLGTSSGSSTTTTTTTGATPIGWYPAWHTEGAGSMCKNDGLQKPYMTDNPTTYISSTLDACCKKYYNWDGEVNVCIAKSGGTSMVTGTNKWYKRSEDWICVQDCVGPSPCGGLAASWEEASYATRKACCNTLYNADCMTITIPANP